MSGYTSPCSTVDPDLWFSESEDDKRAAKAICATCPLQLACRERGRTEEYGIWGGVESVPATDDKQALRAEKYANVRALFSTGLTKTEIARQLGIPRPTVHLIITTVA